MALKCKQSARQITISSRRKSTAPRLRHSRLTLVFVGEGLAPPSCFSLLLLVAAYSSRLPTAQIESAFPIKNATKQIPNTEWSNEAPKYCHIAAPPPGKPAAKTTVTINNNPNPQARRTQTPNVNAIPIANSPYATRNAIGRACGSTNPRKIGAMNGYATPCKNLLIQNSNPPCKLNCVPKTSYCPKHKNTIPTQMRKNASARSFPR